VAASAGRKAALVGSGTETRRQPWSRFLMIKALWRGEVEDV
jgi:hypothetical protein